MDLHDNSINDFLSPELLLTVFLMNAMHNDATTKERVQNTIASTHVCRAWRSLLIDTSSIWGQLIYVKHTERQNDKEIDMMHEILRRSRESFLTVHAELRNYRTGGGHRKLLDHILITHWPRIQTLEIHFAGIMRRSHKNHFLSHLTRPSPHLRACHIQVDSSWSVGNAENHEIGLSPPLFGDMAPNLHYLRADYLAIPSNAQWLSGLTTLITDYHSKFTTSVLQTLGVLSGLAQLSHLELLHEIPETVPDLASISKYPLVPLPNLTYLAIQGVPENCLALIDRIQRPSTCLANVYATMDEGLDDSGGPDTRNLSVLAQRLFSQTFFQNLTLTDSFDSLFIALTKFSLTLADRQCFRVTSLAQIGSRMSPSVNLFAFSPLFPDYAPGTGLQILRSIFQSTIMQNVTTLYLSAHLFSLHPGSLEPLLSNVCHVRTLELDSVDTLKALCEHGDSSPGPLPFLHLEIFGIRLSSWYQKESEPEDDDTAEREMEYITPIATFLRPREVNTLRAYSAYLPYWRGVFKADTRMTEILCNTKLELLNDPDAEGYGDLFWDSDESDSDGEYSEGEE
ncbi:hypothetical protein D9613_009429 [Agrocybe pediades]|uniref:F-box domain-containing protein n=1 Tax=Agrocybe pediades TaxID=84607 RepID=A0A8H4VTQ2_9AGAR|nr:hypothetical protein D9613_009429 [Agrocybe pediades]